MRTKAFKRWFGDWELANLYNRAVEAWNNKDSKGKVVFGLSDRAKARFAEILGKDIKQLVITDDSIRHIKNYHSQNEELRGQKDMLPEDVVVIPYLINNYDFMNPSPDHNDKMGNRAIEIRKRINGISVIATIEKGKDKEFLVTNYQFIKSDALDASTETPGLNVRNDSDIANIQKDIKNIKNAATNASKVVDANGEPLVVYHGSNWKGITTFDRSQSKRRRSGLREYGHFFTTNRALAEMYAAVEDAPDVKEEIDSLDAQIEQAAEAKDIGKMLDLYTEKERITRNLGGRVYEVFLNLRDVAEFDADYQADKGWYNLKADVGYKTAIGRDAMEAYAGQNSMTGDRLRKDGIIGRNIIDLFVGTENKEALKPYYDKYGGDVFLVFDPQNIKSASENEGTFDATNPDIRYLRGSSEGEVYGWMSDGKIYLTEKGLNPETPIHEYTHIWDAVCQRENPKLWAEGVALMKQTPLWEEVRNNPAYANIADNENALASEVHARLAAPGGTAVLVEMMEQQKAEATLIGRIHNWLRKFWRWLRKKEMPESKLNVDKFARMPLKDLAMGKRQLAAATSKGSIRYRSKAPMSLEEKKRQTEEDFGGIWIEDREEYAKFVAATTLNAFEHKGEGVTYTDNYFYAYYRNTSGEAVPFVSVYLNEYESQDVVNYVKDEIENDERGNEQTIRETIAKRFGSDPDTGYGIDGRDGSVSSASRDGILGGHLLRKGRYADAPELFRKGRRAYRTKAEYTDSQRVIATQAQTLSTAEIEEYANEVSSLSSKRDAKIIYIEKS